jgi:periplasmic divalent cation tolerance protein
MASTYAAVLVTAPSIKVARAIARTVLNARLAACVNLIPSVESHYWWQNRLERGREILLLIKTTKARLAALEKTILKQHPYDTPEFVVLDISRGARRYLDWIAASVLEPARGGRARVVRLSTN